MQHNPETIALIDSVVSTFGGVIAQIKSEIRELREAHGLPVLESIEDGVEYKDGTLAAHRNGLFVMRGGKWVCVSNGVADVDVKQGSGGTAFQLFMSDGTIIEKAFPTPKVGRKKPVAVAA